MRLVVLFAAISFSGVLFAGDAAQKPFDEILNQKIDVDYWRVYLSEILETLGARTGLKYAYPATLDSNYSFTFQQKDITIKALLEKLAATAQDEVEFRDRRVFFWHHADDKQFAELEQKLKSTERWTRCDAVYALGQLSDKRVYPLLFKALGDSNPGVVNWTLAALKAHTAVIPYVDVPGKDALVTAVQKKLGLPDEKGLRDNYGIVNEQISLLGAASTPAAAGVLTSMFKSSDISVRVTATIGLGLCQQPAALDALIAAANDKQATENHALVSALAQQSSPRSTAVLIALARKEVPADAAADKAQNGLQQNIAMGWTMDGLGRVKVDPAQQLKATLYCALSKMSERSAQEAVVQMLKNKSEFTSLAGYMFGFSARDAGVADALVPYLSETDELVKKTAAISLGNAGDFRAMNALMQMINGKNAVNSGAVQALAAIRDSRAEEEFLKLCKNPPQPPADLPLWQRQMPINWLSLMLQTRNPNVAAVFFDDMQDAKTDIPTRTRMAQLLMGGLVEQTQVAKFTDYLLNVDDLPFMQDLLIQGFQPRYYLGNGFMPPALIPDDRLVERLVKLSQQPFPKGNGQATMISGALSTTQDANGRKQLIKGNPAVTILASTPIPSATREILAMMGSQDAEIRTSAVLSTMMEPSRSDPDTVEALAARLNDPIDAIKMHAIEELAQRGDKRVAEALKEAIAKPTPAGNNDWQAKSHRWQAASLLLKMGDPGAKEAVLALVKEQGSSYSDGDVRYLGDIKSSATQDLMRTIMNDTSIASDRREQAALALYSNNKDPEALAALFDVLKTPMRDGVVNGVHLGATDHNSRVRILNSLQQANDPKIGEMLYTMITDNNVTNPLRNFTVENLNGEQLTPEMRAKFLALSKDENSPADLRLRIAAMLCGHIGHWQRKPEKSEPEALATVLKLYKDKAVKADTVNMIGTNSLTIACGVLAQSGDAGAKQALIDSLKSDDTSTRMAAASALTQWTRDEAAIDYLLQIIKSNAGKQDRQNAQWQLQSVSQDPKVAEAVKQKIRTVFDEMNKPQKPPAPPKSDF
jgi:HEAT repeat protein